MKSHSASGLDPAARSRARRRALQAIYAWQLSGNPVARVIDEFRHEQDMEIADLDYFEDLVRGVDKHCAELDAALVPHLDREIDRVDPIERAALRIGAYELGIASMCRTAWSSTKRSKSPSVSAPTTGTRTSMGFSTSSQPNGVRRSSQRVGRESRIATEGCPSPLAGEGLR